VLIEASGNDPFIVMPSAPIDMVARGAAFAAFLNCGQVCTSAERFYVHDDVFDEFVEGLGHRSSIAAVGQWARAGGPGPDGVRA
jgi:acyl-CoA reductase-like NAD-dependent aldehyde dehydrogenase